MQKPSTVTPITTLDRAGALAWLRAQPGGSITLRRAELARRWDWHREQVDRQLRAWVRAGVITWTDDTVTATDPSVTPETAPLTAADPPSQLMQAVVTPAASPVTSLPPAEPQSHTAAHTMQAIVTPAVAAVTPVVIPVRPAVTPAVDAAAYAVSIGLAGVAAWFSIHGMVTLFPGTPVSIIVFAGMLETGKLVTTAWVAARWDGMLWLTRFVLMAFVVMIASINAAGVYAQLTSAHIGDRAEASGAVQVQDAEIAARIEVATAKIADLDKQIAQIDAAVAEAANRGNTRTAMNVMGDQKTNRAGLVAGREKAAQALVALKAERAGVAVQGRRIETEAAPIQSVAELFGIHADPEQLIHWLIALMVLCCDPLAIALMAAVSAHRAP